MTRSPALIKAQADYEKKRNARKVLLRLSEEEAAFVDRLPAAFGIFDATREQAIRHLIRDTMERFERRDARAGKPKR